MRIDLDASGEAIIFKFELVVHIVRRGVELVWETRKECLEAGVEVQRNQFG